MNAHFLAALAWQYGARSAEGCAIDVSDAAIEATKEYQQHFSTYVSVDLSGPHGIWTLRFGPNTGDRPIA